ncbi:MAG: hypothetical protein V3T49_06920 [Dehalococcoidia bacterium]
MHQPDTPFVSVLKTVFKDRSTLPERCVVSLGIEVNQPDYSDVVEIVAQHGGLDDLRSRLVDSHPTDRPHLDEFDRQFWTVWNEAAAFAWAVERGFTGVAFTDDHATTDVSADHGVMIEAKTVDVSPEERQVKNQMSETSDLVGAAMRGPSTMIDLHPIVLKKFEDGLIDSVRKFERQSGEQLVAFFELAGLDWPTSRRQAIQLIRQWAAEAAQRTGARIVVWEGDAWREPFIDTGR